MDVSGSGWLEVVGSPQMSQATMPMVFWRILVLSKKKPGEVGVLKGWTQEADLNVGQPGRFYIEDYFFV